MAAGGVGGNSERGGASSETGEGLDCAVSSLVHPTAKLVKNSANGLKPVSTLLATSGKVEQNMILDLRSNHNSTTLSLSSWDKYSICKMLVSFLTF